MRTQSGAAAPTPPGVPDVPGNRVIALLIACIVAVNAYSYVMVAAIPLVQSDVWRFMDGFLGDFIEHGFTWSSLLAQANPQDTNLPLQKLFLFFHTQFFGMDFRLEGLLGVAAGALLVLVLARKASGMPLRSWKSAECWLVAALALVTLSLNSTNVYTWPLATQWFVPVLIAATYFSVVQARIGSAVVGLCATFMLGVLLDEVAYPVFAAALGALALARSCRGIVPFRRLLLCGGTGLIAARLLYWLAPTAGGTAGVGTGLSFTSLLNPDIWKSVFIPFSDVIIHQANQRILLESGFIAFAWIATILTVIAHVWFWWRCIFAAGRGTRQHAGATFIAAATMLFFYGLVLGVVLQRVPAFGFEYLHQPRYVMFYQLHLAALTIMFYAEYRDAGSRLAWRRAAAALLVTTILSFGALQVRLSTLAWEHVKYLSKYVEGAALTLGRIAEDPSVDIPCADILTICEFAPDKRRAILSMLTRHRLNIFSPEFQAFHRLYPYPPVQVVAPAPKPASPAQDRDDRNDAGADEQAAAIVDSGKS